MTRTASGSSGQRLPSSPPTAALEDVPGYRLAELMEELISGGKIAPVAADETTGYKKP